MSSRQLTTATMYFGAHVSIAGGVFNAPLNAAALGCEVFQMFTRSPHGGSVPDLTPEIVKLFRQNCKLAGQREWYVHAPYFINFASGNNRIHYGSINAIRKELERGSLLGAAYVMTHLGSYKDLGKRAGFVQLIEGLEGVFKQSRRDALQCVSTKNAPTKLLIENSAGAGGLIGVSFEDLAKIIHHPKLKKYHIGICLDTQHAFASGYDLRTPEAVKKTLKKFDDTVGLANLKMFHGNDSKTELGSRRDRHEHIGAGFIGQAGFTALLSSPKLQNVNLIAETEHDKVREDLKILKKIRASL